MIENLLLGLAVVIQPLSILALFFGVSVGLIVGALPGLNDNITLAVLIPVTFGMEPHIGMMILVGIYCSACYGGSIPAILLKIPGTASSIVTTLDGHPMTLKGEAGKALGISTTSSVFGGLMSSLVLMFIAPFLAHQALKFGPPEYFALAILGISTVAGMAGKSLLKNLIAGAIGLFIAMIGMAPQTGFPRFYFGNNYILEGIPFVPMLIGLFGITSVFELAEHISKEKTVKYILPKVTKIMPTKKMIKRLLPTWVTSGAIGNVIGIIPGAGMLMAIYLSYDVAKRRNKDKEFGTGVPEGVASAEAANNAVVASSMVPLLSLGIPGNSASALFIGALMIQGLRPGPALFVDHPNIAYSIIVGFFVANLFMGPLGILISKFLATYILRIPRQILSGVIVALCATGAFAISNSIFNVWVMIIFGLIGYIFNKLSIPHSPLILTLVLGAMMERNYLQSMVLSKGSWLIFMQRPLSAALLIISLFFFATPFISKLLKKPIITDDIELNE